MGLLIKENYQNTYNKALSPLTLTHKFFLFAIIVLEKRGGKEYVRKRRNGDQFPLNKLKDYLDVIDVYHDSFIDTCRSQKKIEGYIKAHQKKYLGLALKETL